MSQLTYTAVEEKLLRRLDPQGDLDSAHDAWMELQGAKEGNRPTMAALVDRTRWRACDYRRRQRLQSARYLGQRIQPKPIHTPESLTLEQERSDLVRCSVCKLPPRCREAITLRFLEELPVRQVAARLGIGEVAVYKRLERGYRLLASDEALAGLYDPVHSERTYHGYQRPA